MRNKINITKTSLLFLNLAFYSKTAFSAGITAGYDDSGRIILIFIFFFVFPAIGLSIVFVIAKIICNKRNLTKTNKLLNRIYIFLLLALFIFPVFITYQI